MIDTPRIPANSTSKIPSIQSTSNQNILHQVPTAVLSLPKDTALQGNILQQDAQGNTLIATAKGNISLKTPFLLKSGDSVHLLLLTSGNNVELQLTSVNGKIPNGLPHIAQQTQASTSSTAQPGHIIFRFSTPLPSTGTPSQHVSAASHTTIHSFQSGKLLPAIFTAPQSDTIAKIAQHFTADAKTGQLSPVPQQSSLSTQLQFPQIQPGSRITIQIISGTLPAVTAVNTITPTVNPTVPNTNIPANITAEPSSITSPARNIQTTASSSPIPANQASTLITHAYQNTTSTTRPGTTPTQQNANTGLSSPSHTTPATLPSAANTSTPPNASSTLAQTAPQATRTPPPISISPTQIVYPTFTLQTQTTPPPPSLQLTNTALPQITGVVVGTEKSGDVVLNTPIGSIKIASETPLPKDTTLTFTLITLPTAQNQASTTLQVVANDADGVSQLLRHWQSIDDVSQTLHKADQRNADELLRQILPTADKNLGIRLLNFMSAVKTGDIQQWLGPRIISILQKAGKGDLIDKAGKEFVTLRHIASDSSSTHWQSVLFPVYDGEELHQTRMFVRHYEQEEGHDPSDEHSSNARFVVEVDLQTMGKLQLDGLIRTKNNTKIFDLVVRGNKELPGDMRHGITTIFSDTLEITGLKGYLSFEHMDEFPINPSEDILGTNTPDNPDASILA